MIFKDLGMQTAVSANIFTSFPVRSHLPLSTTQSTTAFTLKSTDFRTFKWRPLTVAVVMALSKSFTRSSTCTSCQWNFCTKISKTLQRGWRIVPPKEKRRQMRNTSNIFSKQVVAPSLKLTLCCYQPPIFFWIHTIFCDLIRYITQYKQCFMTHLDKCIFFQKITWNAWYAWVIHIIIHIKWIKSTTRFRYL